VQTTTRTQSHILSLLLYNDVHKMTGCLTCNRTILLTYIQHRVTGYDLLPTYQNKLVLID